MEFYTHFHYNLVNEPALKTNQNFLMLSNPDRDVKGLMDIVTEQQINSKVANWLSKSQAWSAVAEWQGDLATSNREANKIIIHVGHLSV